MNDGVKILLERMETHPEEFVIEEGVVGKWDSLVRSYEGVLPPEDLEEYKKARNALLQQQFTEKVMEELIDPKKSSLEDVINQYRAKGISSAGATQGAYTVSNNGAVTSWENRESLQTELMKTHIDAHLKALKQEVKESPKTLFGRLFNYQ